MDPSTLPRRAKLQRRLLAELRKQPAQSIAELARRAETSRPAASRALASLRERGLAERDGREWRATTAGDALVRAEARLTVGDLVRVLGDRSLVMDTSNLFTDIRRVADLAAGVSRRQEWVVDAMAVRSITDAFVASAEMRDALSAAGAVKVALASSLALQADSIARIQKSFLAAAPFVYEAINVPIARIGSGLAAIDNVMSAGRAATDLQTGLARAAATVAQSFSLHAEIVLAEPKPAMLLRLLLPAETTADVVETASEISEPTGHGIASDDPEDVAALLERVAPRLARMWRGAWQAARGATDDGPRQACDSAREVLGQVLHELTPGAPTGTQQTERVSLILGGESESLRDWAVATANAIRASYALLSAESHTRREEPRMNRQALYGHLECVGGLLRFLLSVRSL